MKDEEKTKKQLITELNEMRRRINELETSELDRTQREEVLRESEERYKTLIEHARDVIYTVSLDTTITSLSPAFEKITGFSRSEWIGKKIEEIIHPDDWPLALEMGKRLLGGEKPPIHEVRIRTKSTEYIPSEFNIAEQLKNGKVIGIIGIGRDISERKQVEDENRKFYSLIENSNEFIGLATLDGKPIYLNEAGLKLVGLDNLEEARTLTIYDFVSAKARKKLVDEILPNVMKKGYYSGTDRLRHFRTGSEIDIEYTVFTTKSPDPGDAENIAAVVTDITERIQAEKELRKYRNNLEQLVEERTGQLSKTIKQLKQEITERKRIEDALQRISKATIEFVEPTFKEDPYEFICKELKELVGDAVISVNSFDYEQGILVTRKILGITEQKLEKVSKFVGEKILGISFENIDKEIKDKLFSGKLHEVKERLYGIFFHQVPESVCLEIEKLVGVKDILSIGFRRSGKLFGNASIFTLGDTRVNTDIVETFINLASIVLERRHAEDALKESEERFRTLIQKIQAAVVVHRADTSIEISNTSAQKLLGLTEHQMMEKTATDPAWMFFHEDGTVMPTEEYPVHQVVANKKPLRDFSAGIYRPSIKDTVWVLVNADPVFDDQSRLAQVIVTFMDITVRKNAEDALRENEENLLISSQQWQVTFDAIKDAIMLLTPEGRILQHNQAMARMLKIPDSEIIGNWCWDLMHGTSGPIEGCPITRMKESLQRESLMLSLGDRIFEISADPVLDNSNNLTGAVHIISDITDRKQTEEALRKSEEKLKEAQRMGKIGHWEFDIESQEITLSGQAFKLIGLDPNRGPPDVKEGLAHFFKEDSGRMLKHIAQANESGEPFEMDYKIRLPSGKLAHHYSTFHPIRDQSGRVSNFMGTVQDITELKKVEEELREKEYIIESSSSAIATTDLKGNMTYINPAFLKKWGFDNAEEFMGRPLIEFWEVEDKLDEIMQALSGKGTWFGEIPAKRKDGTLFDVQVSAATVFNKEGTPVALTSTSIDITERKQVEEALSQSKQRLSLHVKKTPLGVIEWNFDFEVVEWNPAAEHIFGFTREEAIGRHAAGLIVPKRARNHVNQIWKDLCSQQGGLRSTNENVTKDGDIILCEWYNTPLIDHDGKILGVASLIQDITERKRSEQEREKLITELQEAISKIKTLSGMLPICTTCKKIRDDKGYWNRIEKYIMERSETEFSHSICPECMDRLYRDEEWYKKK